MIYKQPQVCMTSLEITISLSYVYFLSLVKPFMTVVLLVFVKENKLIFVLLVIPTLTVSKH